MSQQAARASSMRKPLMDIQCSVLLLYRTIRVVVYTENTHAQGRSSVSVQSVGVVAYESTVVGSPPSVRHGVFRWDRSLV